ncbi:hypothetical protein SRHO_G00169600 [Serrasalmus rhombeus]
MVVFSRILQRFTGRAAQWRGLPASAALLCASPLRSPRPGSVPSTPAVQKAPHLTTSSRPQGHLSSSQVKWNSEPLLGRARVTACSIWRQEQSIQHKTDALVHVSTIMLQWNTSSLSKLHDLLHHFESLITQN